MPKESRPNDCPLYPNKESVIVKVRDRDFVVKFYEPAPGKTDPNGICLAEFLPDWNPNVHSRGTCRKCGDVIDVTPKDTAWGRI